MARGERRRLPGRKEEEMLLEDIVGEEFLSSEQELFASNRNFLVLFELTPDLFVSENNELSRLVFYFFNRTSPSKFQIKILFSTCPTYFLANWTLPVTDLLF